MQQTINRLSPGEAVHIDKKRRTRNDFLFKVIFAAPGVIIYTGIMLMPIIWSIWYSLNKWEGFGPLKYVGLKNYIKMFTSSEYQQVTGNTLTLVLASLLVTMPLALSMAYLIYRTSKGFKFFRAVAFLPNIISPIVIGLLFSILFNGDFGPINALLRKIGLGNVAHPWLSDIHTALPTVIISQIWQNIGYFTIIFLAGMQSVNAEYLESALIDGANSFQVFIRIMIPCIAEVFQIIIILIATGALKSFGFSYAMTAGGPGYATTYFTVYIYRKAFVESAFGISSSASFITLIYAVIFLVLFKALFRRILDHD